MNNVFFSVTEMNNFGNNVLSPFETINQERLEPSKVEAIQSMFENRGNFFPLFFFSFFFFLFFASLPTS